jgi:hypothetical protein
MKLYEVLRGSYIRIIPQEPYSKFKKGDQIDLISMIDQIEFENSSSEFTANVAPHSTNVSQNEILKFNNIDGMYSLCYKLDQETYEETEICHIAAYTEVEIVDLDEIFSFDRIREIIGRAGYGKDRKGPYRHAALKDMSDSWVEASIEYVPKDHPHRKYYIEELTYRKLMNISIPDRDA